MKKIVVIGSSNVDMIIQLKNLPKPGETITGGTFSQAFGGKGANQAVGAARASDKSISVSFITCLGEDDHARLFIESLTKDNLNVDFAFREKGFNTGTALIMVDESGTNCIGVAPGANFQLHPEHIDQSVELMKEAAYIILQMEIPVETTKYILDTAAKLNCKVILNVAPAIPIEDSYLEKLEILIVNETEASEMTGIVTDTDENIQKAAEVLRRKGAKSVIITLGSAGSYVNDGKTKEFVKAYQVKAIDTTAAGDTYCGALAVALTEGKTIVEAIKFASAASALSVTRLGAQPSVPWRNEIDKFISSNS